MIVGAVQMLLGGVAKDYWFGIFTRTAGGSTRFVGIYPLGVDLIVSGRTAGSEGTIFSISTTSAINWVTSTRETGATDGSFYEGLYVSSSNVIYAAGRSAKPSPAENNNIALASLTSAGAVNYLIKGARSSAAEEFLTSMASDGTYLYATGMHGFTSGGPASERDVYLVKYNLAGTVQWQLNIGNSSQMDYGNRIGIDSSANSYVVGDTYNATPPSGTSRACILKCDTSGNLQWQKQLFDSGYYSSFAGIAVSSTGDSYCVGYRISGNPIIAKYNSSGTLSFQRQLNFATGYGSFNDMFLAADGFIYAVGYAQQAAFGGLIAKYNTSGTLQWQRTIVHSSLDVNIFTITVSVEGTMYLAGEIGTNGFMAALPSDGTLTGTYGSYTYASSSFTDQTTSMTDSSPSFSSSTASVTYSTPSVTTTSQTLTVTKQTV